MPNVVSKGDSRLLERAREVDPDASDVLTRSDRKFAKSPGGLEALADIVEDDPQAIYTMEEEFGGDPIKVFKVLLGRASGPETDCLWLLRSAMRTAIAGNSVEPFVDLVRFVGERVLRKDLLLAMMEQEEVIDDNDPSLLPSAAKRAGAFSPLVDAFDRKLYNAWFRRVYGADAHWLRDWKELPDRYWSVQIERFMKHDLERAYETLLAAKRGVELSWRGEAVGVVTDEMFELLVAHVYVNHCLAGLVPEELDGWSYSQWAKVEVVRGEQGKGGEFLLRNHIVPLPHQRLWRLMKVSRVNRVGVARLSETGAKLRNLIRYWYLRSERKALEKFCIEHGLSVPKE